MTRFREERQPARIDRRTLLRRAVWGTCAVGGLGAAMGLKAARNRSSSPQRIPTIVLITLDTTRADHLGCYGYSRNTTPHLDRFAAESLVHTRAISPATWTLPAHASLFTGKFPRSHGVHKAEDGSIGVLVPDYGKDDWTHLRAWPLSSEELTLAQRLRQAGYVTRGVVAGPWLKADFGMNRGFDSYDDENILTVNGRAAEEVTDRALQLLTESPEQPTFLFLNYFDAHLPYDPPEEFERLVDADDAAVPRQGDLWALNQLAQKYDGELRYLDHHLGRLFAGLKARGLYDDALIVVTGDHGELLGEHGRFAHPGFVHQESVHVPLIVKSPGGVAGGTRSEGWVQLIDVFPLILDAAGVALPTDIQGQLPSDVSHPIVVESPTLASVNGIGDWLAIIDGDWKYVTCSEGDRQLFHLGDDPRELNNLYFQELARARAMDNTLYDYLASLPEPGAQQPVSADQQTHRALKSLGYTR